MLSARHARPVFGVGSVKSAASKNNGGLVYSTESGRMCPACRQPMAQCTCRSSMTIPAPGGVVRVSRETGGRGGKTVTVINGLALDAAALIKFAKQLKSGCGTGGTVKDGTIELQGDHCDAVMAALTKNGWRVKRAGG